MLKDNGLPELYSEEDEVKHKIVKLGLNEKVVKPQERKAPLIKQTPKPVEKRDFYLVHGEKVKDTNAKDKTDRTRNSVENRSDLKHMFLKDKNETEPEENG